MRILRVKYEKDYTGMWVFPTVGFSWVKKDYTLWFGWLFWQWCVEFRKDMKVKRYLDKNLKEIKE